MVLIVVSNLSEEVDLLDETLEALLMFFDDDLDDEMIGELGELFALLELDIALDGEAVEPVETMVAACWELKTETMEEAIAEVLTVEVEWSVLLADLSCGLTE